MTIINQAISTIDTMLAPVTPAGVTAVQFISVFLIVYAITLMMISRIPILKDQRPAQLIISIAIAYFTSTSTLAVILITSIFPGLGVTTMMIISFLAILAMILTEEEMKKIKWAPLIILIAIITIMSMTWSSISTTLQVDEIPIPQLTQDQWFTLIFIGLFIGAILLISLMGREPRKHKRNPVWDFIRMLRGDYDWKEPPGGGEA